MNLSKTVSFIYSPPFFLAGYFYELITLKVIVRSFLKSESGKEIRRWNKGMYRMSEDS
jgi:hypothetical protein